MSYVVRLSWTTSACIIQVSPPLRDMSVMSFMNQRCQQYLQTTWDFDVLRICDRDEATKLPSGMMGKAEKAG